MNNNLPPFISICGTKNSGKTTLITKLINRFKKDGFKIGTIKHDFHGFNMDNIDSDTDRHKKSGAVGTLIVSKNNFMLLKDKTDEKLDDYLFFLKESDLVILEGFKNEPYPKIEIIRKEISSIPVSNNTNLLFYATDVPELLKNNTMNTIELNDTNSIFKRILDLLLQKHQQ